MNKENKSTLLFVPLVGNNLQPRKVVVRGAAYRQKKGHKTNKGITLLPRLTAVLPAQGREMNDHFASSQNVGQVLPDNKTKCHSKLDLESHRMLLRNNKTLKRVQGDDKRGFARSVTPQGRYTGYSGSIGFTLIELLVVVLIIGILAAVALPQYQKAIEKSRATEALRVLNDVYREIQVYFLTHGVYPSSFTELESAPAWKEKQKYYTYSGAVYDFRSNENWSLELFKGGNVGIGRISGPYKGAGFHLNSNSEVNNPNHEILCFEGRSQSPLNVVRFTKDPGTYCEKLFQGTQLPGSSAQVFYRIF